MATNIMVRAEREMAQEGTPKRFPKSAEMTSLGWNGSRVYT
jgi:hypothetical protein